MRHPQRTVLAVLNAVQTEKSVNVIAAEHGVSSRTVAKWQAEYHGRIRPDLWFRLSELKRLPSIEAQVVEWIDLMVARDTVNEFTLIPSATLRWAGVEVHCRWSKWREVDGQKVRAFEVARINVPEKLRGRGWFRTFISLLKKVSPSDGIIVEEAHQTRNPWMRSALTSWGFRELFKETYWFDMRRPLCRCPHQTTNSED